MMQLLLLYGPPAVGKLTVAKAIARLTGFKVFHAHLTVDLLTPIFPRDTPAYRTLVWEIRYAVFAEAARAHLDGLIFTTVYGPDRAQYIAQCVDIVERGGGEVCFVHLYCSVETLRQRVVRDDRKRYGKITSVELLNATLSQREPLSPCEATTRWNSLSLNTDVLSPVAAAHQVIAHYRLPTKQDKQTTEGS
jgi:shikimate kinase